MDFGSDVDEDEEPEGSGPAVSTKEKKCLIRQCGTVMSFSTDKRYTHYINHVRGKHCGTLYTVLLFFDTCVASIFVWMFSRHQEIVLYFVVYKE